MNNSFDAWIRSVDSYSGNDLLYLNPRGIIPTAAVIKKGRENPFRERRLFDFTSFAIDGNIKTKEQGGEDDGESEDIEVDNRNSIDAEG